MWYWFPEKGWNYHAIFTQNYIQYPGDILSQAVKFREYMSNGSEPSTSNGWQYIQGTDVIRKLNPAPLKVGRQSKSVIPHDSMWTGSPHMGLFSTVMLNATVARVRCNTLLLNHCSSGFTQWFEWIINKTKGLVTENNSWLGSTQVLMKPFDRPSN